MKGMAKREIAGVTVYGVTDVAQEVGVTPATVRQWIRDGKLLARKVGREWLITEDAVRIFITGVEPVGPEEQEGPVGFQPGKVDRKKPPKEEVPTEPPIMIPKPPRGDTVTS